MLVVVGGSVLVVLACMLVVVLRVLVVLVVLVVVVLVVTGLSSGQTQGGLEHVHGASSPVHLERLLPLQ